MTGDQYQVQREGVDRRRSFGRRSTDTAPLRSKSVDILLSIVAALSSVLLSLVVYEFTQLRSDYHQHKDQHEVLLNKVEVELVGIGHDLKTLRDQHKNLHDQHSGIHYELKNLSDQRSESSRPRGAEK